MTTGMKIGYARVSTNDQDLTAQRNALLALGVEEKQIFVQVEEKTTSDAPHLAQVDGTVIQGSQPGEVGGALHLAQLEEMNSFGWRRLTESGGKVHFLGQGRDAIPRSFNTLNLTGNIKAVGSAYAAGRRGSNWIKVKPVLTYDLVVLACEWAALADREVPRARSAAHGGHRLGRARHCG